MHLDWLLSPFAVYSGAAACLLTSLALFVSIKLEMARVRALAEVSEVVNESDDLVVQALKAEIEKLRESVSIPTNRLTSPILDKVLICRIIPSF